MIKRVIRTLAISGIFLALAFSGAFAEQHQARVAVEWRLQKTVIAVGSMEAGLSDDVESSYINLIYIWDRGTPRSRLKALIRTIPLKIESLTRNGDVFYVICTDPHMSSYSGKIDFGNEARPTVELKTDRGEIIENIAIDGVLLKRKYVPDLDLGN